MQSVSWVYNSLYMNTSFSSLFQASWKLLFSHKKSSGIIFLYQFIPVLLFFFLALCSILLAGFILPWFGVDLSNAIVVQSLIVRFWNPMGMALILSLWLLALLLFITIQLVCSYLAHLGISYLVQKKKFSFWSLFTQWRGVWWWAGTGLSVSLYFIILIVFVMIGALVCAYIYDPLAIVPIVLGLVLLIFLSISLSFTFPIYFLEGKKYFSATERSREIMKNRWWKTFGKFLLLGLSIGAVSLVLFALESWLRYGVHLVPNALMSYQIISVIFAGGAFLYMLAQSAINVCIQIFASLFIFELYGDAVEHSTQNKKKA